MNKKLFYTACFATFLALGTMACGGDDNSGDDGDGEQGNPVETFFPGEVKPAANSACFPGAYYRKVVSSQDKWSGIGGKVVLPTIVFDEDRKNPNKTGQYLDNPSVYLGGTMGGQETDIGMTWEVVKDDNGNVSQARKAFRPFLRRTGYTPTGQASGYENAPAESRYYWYPGEEITISLQIVDNGKLHFTVEGAGKKFECDYTADGYRMNSIGVFKRVNAIDQVANEGKPAQNTKTRVEGSVWKETWLYRIYKSEIVKAPVHNGRFTDMRCPASAYFNITASDAELKVGAEHITIDGGK